MEMGPLQIASEYRTGKNKTKTIQALAELNACTQRQIAQILQEQGEELPGHWKEKLAKGLKSEPVSDRYLRKAIVEAVTPEKETADAASVTSSASLRSAPSPQGEGRGAALSLDGDPASCAGKITWVQYSRLMQLIGRLEGIGFAMEDALPAFYHGCVENLAKLAEEIEPEVIR